MTASQEKLFNLQLWCEACVSINQLWLQVLTSPAKLSWQQNWDVCSRNLNDCNFTWNNHIENIFTLSKSLTDMYNKIIKLFLIIRLSITIEQNCTYWYAVMTCVLFWYLIDTRFSLPEIPSTDDRRCHHVIEWQILQQVRPCCIVIKQAILFSAQIHLCTVLKLLEISCSMMTDTNIWKCISWVLKYRISQAWWSSVDSNLQ